VGSAEGFSDGTFKDALKKKKKSKFRQQAMQSHIFEQN